LAVIFCLIYQPLGLLWLVVGSWVGRSRLRSQRISASYRNVPVPRSTRQMHPGLPDGCEKPVSGRGDG
jgi:hypothetical protein